LDIRFHQEVISACYENDRWQVQTQDNLYRATNLVIAAGGNHEPFLPTRPGQDLFNGRMMHSSQYKNGEPFKEGEECFGGWIRKLWWQDRD
jgi:putative flavoprotein involved in K+ transport